MIFPRDFSLLRPAGRGILFALFLGSSALHAQTGSDSLPPGVTGEMVTRGKAVFTGPGICFACHGMAAEGVSGPSLADTTWLHSRGEYAEIVQLVFTGVDARVSKSGVIMPPRGGSAITDADVRAVAAYVWSLSRRPPPE